MRILRLALAGLLLGVSALGRPSPPVREYTVLFYVAADEEEIKTQSRLTLKKLESLPQLQATADAPVAYVAQIDEAGEDPNYRYWLRHIPSPSADEIDSPPVAENEVAQVEPGFRYGERDSGNPRTLKAFLQWGVRAFPARHYLLFVVGHSWGQLGLMQDFFVDGQTLQSSTLLKNYEVRRVLEEVYRENRPLIPRGRFDALLFDACTSGQFDVAWEFERVVDYFGASAIETPLTSFPYERIFGPFLTAVEAGRPEVLESVLFPALAAEYVRSHGVGGDLAALEGMVDPVEYFVLRTAGLGAVERSLNQLVTALPRNFARRWRRGDFPELDALADMDANADLAVLGRALGRLGGPAAQKASTALARALGVPSNDPSMKKTTVRHPKAKGAWVHLELEREAASWQLSVCQALRAVAGMNARVARVVPVFHQGQDEEIPLCDEAQHEATQPEPVVKAGAPHPVRRVFDWKLRWPGAPAYYTEGRDGSRRLSLWIPRRPNGKLNESLYLRVPGGQKVAVDYVSSPPKDGPSAAAVIHHEEESFPQEVVWGAPELGGAKGLYVVEAHNHGTHFKRGMGLWLKRDFPLDGYYQGRAPAQSVEPSPYGWTVEDYESWWDEQVATGTQGPWMRQGWDFYRLHRIGSTPWAEFLRP